MQIIVNLKDVFYEKTIVICPACHGRGNDYFYDKELCPTCGGKGRMKLILKKLTDATNS